MIAKRKAGRTQNGIKKRPESRSFKVFIESLDILRAQRC